MSQGKVKTYKAGVKEYRETYWMPNYTRSTPICWRASRSPAARRSA